MTAFPIRRDELDTLVVGRSDPVEPAASLMADVAPGVVLHVDPATVDLLRVEVDGDDDTDDGWVARALGLSPRQLRRAADRGDTIDVDAQQVAALGWLGGAVAGHADQAALGRPSPWWSIDAGLALDRLGPRPAATDLPVLAAVPVDRHRIDTGRWHVADEAAGQRARQHGATVVLGTGPAPFTFAVDAGAVPPTIVDGAPASVVVGGAAVEPDLFDLRRGVTARYDDRAGLLDVTVPVAAGAYYPHVFGHQVHVRRRDAPVPVGSADLEPVPRDPDAPDDGGPSAVTAAVRVSRHSARLPLRLVLAREGQHLDHGLAEAAAAHSLAVAACVRARAGDRAGAAALMAESIGRWTALGASERAAGGDALLERATSARPLLAEAVWSTDPD